MNKSQVLDEALSIPTIIENFSNIDNNPYSEISNESCIKMKLKWIVSLDMDIVIEINIMEF